MYFPKSVLMKVRCLRIGSVPWNNVPTKPEPEPVSPEGTLPEVLPEVLPEHMGEDITLQQLPAGPTAHRAGLRCPSSCTKIPCPSSCPCRQAATSRQGRQLALHSEERR